MVIEPLLEPQPAHLRVNMERLAAQVADRVKPKQCVFLCDAAEQPQDTVYPKAIRGTLTYPLPDEATLRAREEALPLSALDVPRTASRTSLLNRRRLCSIDSIISTLRDRNLSLAL